MEGSDVDRQLVNQARYIVALQLGRLVPCGDDDRLSTLNDHPKTRRRHVERAFARAIVAALKLERQAVE